MKFLLWALMSIGSICCLVYNRYTIDSEIIHPRTIFDNPGVLKFKWDDKVIPINLYSSYDRKLQKIINEKVDDGVLVFNPLNESVNFEGIDNEDITPFNWKWVDLEIIGVDSNKIYASILRPHWWLRKVGANIAENKVYISMPEQGIVGWATVKYIRVNQLDTRLWDYQRQGDYVIRPITGKFKHVSNCIYSLNFGGEPLMVTGSHPIWSIDRDSWVKASELNINERVKSKKGHVILLKKQKIDQKNTVYNIEVYRNHNFIVSKDEVLVHNTCWGGLIRYNHNRWQKGIDHIWEGHSFINRQANRSYFDGFYNTKSKIKELVNEARALARANGDKGQLQGDGSRAFFVDMQRHVGYDRAHRSTSVMTIIEFGGQYKNSFPGTL